MAPAALTASLTWGIGFVITSPSGLPRHVTQVPVSASALRAVLQFRSGSHNLPNDVGRRHGIPHFQRLAQSALRRVILLLVMSIICFLNIPLSSMVEVGISTC